MGDAEKRGEVILVGAGPGHEMFNTLWGHRFMGMADVIVVDRLAREAVRISEERPSPEIIEVGKCPGGHGWRQEEINALLIAKAREGKSVVRLKGGDPFIFGHGAEEVEACRAAGIPCRVVPGLTAATAAPTLAGIPLTLRGVAASFHVMTGRLSGTGGEEEQRWVEAARFPGTLVILMGMEALEDIARALIAGGKDPATPAAVIERASFPSQRTTVTTLAALPAAAAGAGLQAPAVLVIGEVVRHRAAPAWESGAVGPLRGARVAVTVSGDAGEKAGARLSERGAEVVHAPLITYATRAWDADSVEDLLRRARMSDFLLFTSHRAVSALRDLLGCRHDIRALGAARILAVGEATATLVRGGLHLSCESISETQGVEGIERSTLDLAGKRVLWLRGADARHETSERLRDRGARVDEAIVYDSAVNAAGVERLRECLRRRSVEAVLWFSPRGVQVALGDLTAQERRRLSAGVVHACIGATTARALGDLGLDAGVVAPRTSAEALVEALADQWRKREERL